MFLLDKGPFYAKGDCVNIDALLISTERFVFLVFRSPFTQQKEQVQHLARQAIMADNV